MEPNKNNQTDVTEERPQGLESGATAQLMEGRVVLTRCDVDAAVEGVRTRSRSGSEARKGQRLVDVLEASRCRDLSASESDSEVSMVTVTDGSRDPSPASSVSGRLWRKRSLERGAMDDVQEPAAKEVARRGRGRPPTTGEYVGLALAKRELNAAREEQLRLQAEQELAEDVRRKKEARAAYIKPGPPATGRTEEQTAAALEKTVLGWVDTIHMVAARSGKLKGTFVRALNEAAENIQLSVAELRSRTASEEVARLEAANARLVADQEVMRREIAELRKLVERQATPAQAPAPAGTPVLPPPSTFEEFARAIMVQVGTMVSARLEGFEGRLLPEKRLRPPLAHERRREEAEAAARDVPMEPTPSAPSTSGAREPSGGSSKKGRGVAVSSAPKKAAPVPPEPLEPKKGSKKTKGKGAAKAATPAAPAAPVVARKAAAPAATAESAEPTSRPQAPGEQPWTEVVRKGTRRATNEGGAKPAMRARDKPPPRQPAAPKPVPQARQQAAKAVKIRPPPRTAAVVITLKPGAEEKGVSYAKVLAEARNRIDLGALGVPPLRVRVAATGARVLEVPGESRVEKADSLASRLREVFEGAEEVQISRPVTTADMRVDGLEDSIAPEELVAALAKAGNCPPTDIKVGEIKKGRAGVGAAFVRCPATVAKAIMAKGGRVPVGWVAARVRVLKERPRRCYRCHALGHVRAQCQAETDRSGECHRCGSTEHKVAACSSPPHCNVCAAAGRKADHLTGGTACAKPPAKKEAPKKKPATTKATAGSQPANSVTEQVVRMEES